MPFEIIDFHTHPFVTPEQNICSHKEYCNMSPEDTLSVMRGLGVSRFCGTVLNRSDIDNWEGIRRCNDTALALRDIYGDAYIPGFHVHPAFVKESCEEIERMHKLGVNLIGELVPYMAKWSPLTCGSEAFSEILDVARSYGMVVNIHTMDLEEMDKMVMNHPDVVFVAAHPGEYPSFMQHMERMRMSKNYYLDISGTGPFRYGMVKHAVDLFGAERLLYGSDFPTCNPSMFVGGILFDSLLTDEQKQMIFADNAKRLLKL